MSVEPLLRPATVEDAEAFVRAHELAWDATLAPIVGRNLEELMPFAQRVEQFRTGIGQSSEAAQAWLAEAAGEVVGIAVCRRDGDTVELRDLYVVPDAWGTGLAARLADAVLESVRGDADEALLWVAEESARARRFYEREGWVLDGESRASVLGPAEVRYRRTLGAP